MWMANKRIYFECTLNYISKWKSLQYKKWQVQNKSRPCKSLFQQQQQIAIRNAFVLLFERLYFRWMYSVAKVRKNVLRVQRQWQHRKRRQCQCIRILSACKLDCDTCKNVYGIAILLVHLCVCAWKTIFYDLIKL